MSNANVGLEEGASVMEAPSIYKVTVGGKEVGLDRTQGVHCNTIVNIGSRKIQLLLLDKFNILPKTEEAKSVQNEVTKDIGAQWKAGTKDVIRGLSKEEEILYLPTFLAVNSKSEKWEETTKLFWCDYKIKVPNNDLGVVLEAGFKFANEETRVAVPIDLRGYMDFKFCIENSDVMKHEDDNPITYTFKMVDKNKMDKEKVAMFLQRKEIDKDYLKLIRSTDEGERTKIDYILNLYGGPRGSGINTKGIDPVSKEMLFEEVKNKDILKFKEYMSDPNLTIKAKIRKYETYRAVTKEGDTYFIDDKSIGTLSALIGYLSDPANSSMVVRLDARLTGVIIE